MARDGTSWAIVLAALGLRLAGLDRKSVWFDEAITYFDAHVPWLHLVDALRSDVHPPLSYVLFHLWPAIDGGDFWLRLPAAVLGAGAAGMAWLWARRIGSPLQADLTGAFVALAPLQIDLAQEARMYGLLLFLTATSLWLLDIVLTGSHHARAWLAYALVAALLLYTHYYGAFLLAAQGLVAVLAIRGPHRRGALNATGALALAGAAFVPWLPVLAQQAGGIQGDYWIARPTMTTLWVTFRDLAAHTPPDEPFRIPLRIAYVVQAALLVFGAALTLGSARQRAAVLLGSVPLGLALAISVFIAPVYAVRYVSPLGLAFGFLLARGVTTLPRPAALPVAIVAFFPLVVSLAALYTDPGYARSDLRAAAHRLHQVRQPDEVVLHLGAFTAAPFDYYRVPQPAQVLETNDRTELCQALRPYRGGWLVTAYAADDDAARATAEAGITTPDYANDLLSEPPLHVLGVSLFHLGGRCEPLR